MATYARPHGPPAARCAETYAASDHPDVYYRYGYPPSPEEWSRGFPQRRYSDKYYYEPYYEEDGSYDRDYDSLDDPERSPSPRPAAVPKAAVPMTMTPAVARKEYIGKPWRAPPRIPSGHYHSTPYADYYDYEYRSHMPSPPNDYYKYYYGEAAVPASRYDMYYQKADMDKKDMHPAAARPIRNMPHRVPVMANNAPALAAPAAHMAPAYAGMPPMAMPARVRAPGTVPVLPLPRPGAQTAAYAELNRHQNSLGQATNENTNKRRRTSANELAILEAEFQRNPLPSQEDRLRIADRTGMSPRSCQVWFQNRRQKKKKESEKQFQYEQQEETKRSAESEAREETAPTADPETSMIVHDASPEVKHHLGDLSNESAQSSFVHEASTATADTSFGDSNEKLRAEEHHEGIDSAMVHSMPYTA